MNKLGKIVAAISLIIGSFFCVGCINDNLIETTDSSDVITFSPVVTTTSTKSSVDKIIQGASFPDDAKFSSTVFYLPLKDDGQPNFNKGGHFISMFEVVSKQDGVWRTDATHYWPLSGACYFVNFYPTLDTLLEYKMVSGGKGYGLYADAYTADYNQNFYLTNYTIQHTDKNHDPITDDALKTDSNLSHARVDLMSHSEVLSNVEERASDSFPMQFIHALSQIHFTVEADTDYSYYTPYKKIENTQWYWMHFVQLWVDEIKMTNIKSCGKYSLFAPHWSDENMSQPYTYYPLRRGETKGTEVVYEVDNNGSSVVRNSLADVFAGKNRRSYTTPVKLSDTDTLSLLMIPQLIEESAQLQVKYSMRVMNILTPGLDRYGDNKVMNDYTKTITRSFDLADFCPYFFTGTNMVFRLIVSLDDINLSVNYTDWVEEDVDHIVM